MKKTLLFSIVALLIYSISFSQSETNENKVGTQNFSELKINGLFLILGAFEPTYEYIINEESAIGISAFIPFDKEVSDDIKYYISPYYRFYFGRKNNASGFFAEGFGMLNRTNREIDLFTNEENFKTDFALGFGFGGKWITKKGFIFELSMGIGRNLFNNDDSDYEIVGKGGITLGYRF